MDNSIAKSILLEIKKNLDEAGIPFFLIQGTCLGAIRDGDFVENDKDIDIGVLFEDFKDIPFPGFEKRIISKPFDKVRVIKLDKKGIHADITSYMKHEDERYCHSSIKDYCVVQPANIMENYEQVEFCGEIFNVPKPYETYLRNEYGKWWIKSDDSRSKSRVYEYLKKRSIDPETA